MDDPMRPEPEAAGEMPAPITGTPAEPPVAVIPSAAEQRADAKGRVGNTVTQVGIPAALVTIGTWAAALGHVDLDPGPGTDMPTIVTGAFITVLAWLLARWMNRAGLSAED